MSEPERKIFKSDPPFRLKQETEHTHKLYFLYFINQRAPEVSDSLRQLTEECKSLFGDFPESATYYGDDKQRQEQWRINRVFGECINSETRKNSGYTRWQDILTETDANLKSALNELKLYWDKRDIYVKDLMNNRKDEFRKIVSEVYKIPEKEITDADLDPALGGVYYRNLRKTDKDFVKLENIADKKKGELESFQQAFDSAVNKFSLTKSWLERAAFLAIWSGTGKLHIDLGFTENIEPNLIKEIKKKLGRKEELNQFGFVDYEIPLHNPFVYQKHYSSFHSFEEYETDAIDEYKKFLQSYINLLKVSFKNHGYVSKRGAPYDFTLVRWLVDWTILQHSKEEILQDIKTETGEDLDNSTLNKHFRRFRTYDLPVR